MDIADEIAKTVVEETVDDKVASEVSKWLKGDGIGRKFLIGAGITIAATSILDMLNSSGEKAEAKEQQIIQQKNQTRKDNRSRSKHQYAGTEYEPENFDGFVQQMFNQRTNHTRMGNSKR